MAIPQPVPTLELHDRPMLLISNFYRRCGSKGRPKNVLSSAKSNSTGLVLTSYGLAFVAVSHTTMNRTEHESNPFQNRTSRTFDITKCRRWRKETGFRSSIKLRQAPRVSVWDFHPNVRYVSYMVHQQSYVIVLTRMTMMSITKRKEQ